MCGDDLVASAEAVMTKTFRVRGLHLVNTQHKSDQNYQLKSAYNIAKKLLSITDQVLSHWEYDLAGATQRWGSYHIDWSGKLFIRSRV